jgi:capsule polysaccharide export protein KpsE/RkpR
MKMGTGTSSDDLGQEPTQVSESGDLLISELDPLHGLDHGSNGSGGGEPSPPASHSISPFEVVQLTWAHRTFLLRATLAALMVFTLIAFLLPKHYTATTRLMPPDYGSNLQMALAMPALNEGSGSASSGAGGSVMGIASQLLGLNTSGDLFVGVLQSQTVEDHIIDKFNLMDLYSARYIQDARDKLEDRTDIKSDRKSGIISIAVADKSPVRAAAMAKMYVEELDRALALVNTSAAHRERVFIEGRLKEVKQELDASAKEFAAFSSQNAAIDVPEQAKAMVTAAAELQAELIAAQSELKGLQQIYTEKNIRVKSLQAHVGELHHQLEKFGGKDVNPATDSSLAQTELYPSIRQLPLVGVKYLDLYRRSKINEAVFEFLTKEYEIAKVEEARQLPSVQVLDPAIVPDKKSFPHRLLIMLAGVLLGFLFSSAWIVGRTVWERVDASDARKLFAQEVFYTVKAHTWDTRSCRNPRERLLRLVAKLHWLKDEPTSQPEAQSRALDL